MKRRTRKPMTPYELLTEEYIEENKNQQFIDSGILPEILSIAEQLKNGKKVDFTIANILGEALGTSAQFWFNVQNSLDEFENAQQNN